MSDDIPASMRAHYTSGQEDRRNGRPLPESWRITPADAWYRAGWHDEDMAMGNSVIEVAA